MATYFLQKLIEQGRTGISDEAFNEREAHTRDSLISLFVRPDSVLVHDKSSADINYPVDDGFLYLGTHLCGDRSLSNPDNDLWVELQAWLLDGQPSDWVSWNLATFDHLSWIVEYCPFCGCQLRDLLNTYD